jgi:glutamate dehydrogenase (NAD(P)+)
MSHEPYISLTVSHPYFGRLGYLVIDTTFNGCSVGGVRILPDVSLEEITSMARTMTKKYLFSGMPCGGAKAGIVLSGRAATNREDALLAFGRAIAPYINSGFWPGCDMGASMDDIRVIIRGAGLHSFQKDIHHRTNTQPGVSSLQLKLLLSARAWDGKAAG